MDKSPKKQKKSAVRVEATIWIMGVVVATIWMAEDFSGAFGCQGGTMNNYKIKPELEPTDKYEKAKQDLLKAMKSMQDLKPEERRALAQEVFGAAYVETVLKFFMSINQNRY